MKKIFYILILIATFVFSAFVALAEDIPQEREPFEYKLMVPLPTSEGTVASTTGIVDYIKTLYLFGIGISGVIAMSLIVIAGFQWVTAAGKMSAVTQAKSRITNAIFGLVILLASYLILNTINPALVNLKEPYIYFIKWTEPFEDPGSTVGGGGLAWCFEADGVTPKITSCDDYRATGHLGECNTDPCGVGKCFKDVTRCDSCSGISGCTQYNDSDSCKPSDPCGFGGCSWSGFDCS